jgi:predicted dehydrogenase
MAGKVGIGIIGTNMWANRMANGVNASAHAEIVGLAEIQAGVGESFAKARGIDVPIFEDYNDLLKLDGLDAVIITTPNSVHAPVAIAAAEAGKHVHCQKPMATSVTDAKAMTAAVEKAGVVNMVGYSKRFFNGTKFLKNFLSREDLGRIYHVRIFYLQDWLSNPKVPLLWRLQKEFTGTGALGDLGSHITDLSQFIVGDEIKRVSGMMTTFIHERPVVARSEEKGPVDVDDAAMWGAEFANGAMGVFEVSRNATGVGDNWRIEINAEKGSVMYDKNDGRVMLNMREGAARHADWFELPIDEARYGSGGDENMNEIAHFVKCIVRGEAASPSFATGLQVERVLDAVARSSESGAAADV